MFVPVLIFTLVLMWMWSCPSALALPTRLRVKLFEAHGRIDAVKVRGPFRIVTPVTMTFPGDWVSICASDDTVRLTRTRLDRKGEKLAGQPLLVSQRVVLEPIDRRGVRIKIIRDNIERAYSGRIVFAANQMVFEGKTLPRLSIVNDVPAVEYIASVVGSEAPLHAPADALKAFAVLTTAIVEHKEERDFVGDSTREQAYKGCEHATPNVFAAVKSVYGKRLLYRKAPIHVFFHSTCAGGTSRALDIFGDAARSMPYLTAVNCVYCTASPFWKSKTTALPASTFKRLFDGCVPSVTKYDTARRPVEIAFAEKRISGYEAWLRVGREYGWGKVPGTRYSFRSVSRGGVDYVEATSSGAGHGVGLCQWGAVGLAERGKTFEEILRFYFPGCEVVSARNR